jgi:peptidoglycan/LPS O-acetylase OafA/YrhL
MRKVIAILFYVVAGFSVYMVSLLAFINQPPIAKWAIVGGFTLPVLLFLGIGLAISRFQNWKKHTGIVLVSGAGFTCFVVFTFICLLTTDDFRQQLGPDTLNFFTGYISGGIVLLGTIALGVILLLTSKPQIKQEKALGEDREET